MILYVQDWWNTRKRPNGVDFWNVFWKGFKLGDKFLLKWYFLMDQEAVIDNFRNRYENYYILL